MIKIDYTSLPAHMRDGTRRYVEQGIPPGSFLEAVLCNDLKGAFERADDINRFMMLQWVRWLVMEAPSVSQGSPEKVASWIRRGGLQGIMKDGKE